RLLAAPNIASKHWVYDQYDSTVRTNTAVEPGSDSGVVRIKKTKKALALATDCNARYCYLNPREGARIAVAESARNIVCSGGKPQAITNCLNFGNPYKPEVYYTFTEAIAGMGEACKALGTPVTGGNVSFYNEDAERTVFPTPVIGMVGLIDDVAHITTSWFKSESDVIYLLGECKDEIGASEYLNFFHGLTTGKVPALDMDTELNLQESLLLAIRSGLVASAHDTSEGGFAVALAECCIGNIETPLGADVSLEEFIPTDSLLFGETQSRVIVSVAPEHCQKFAELMESAGQKFSKLGTVGAGYLKINDLINLPLDKLIDSYHHSLKRLAEKFG
ncbi:MAG: phosphoribosylformylglycinamidine synthase subunit PurL, partial [candidate division Zixibacteria bacterium]|nr:phosphoribosylformylglycinamidine synthase subunit PurL [candidate division Zixibacteria bacterium]